MANPQTENGYVKIATEILDHLCAMRIPGEVRQVVDVVIRKTYGYHKKEDVISNSQLCEMTGLKKQNAYRALSKAITHKLVIKSDDKLAMNKNWEEWVPFVKVIKSDDEKPVIQFDNKVIKSDDKSSSKVMDTIDNKDTLQKITTTGAIFSTFEENCQKLTSRTSGIINDLIDEYSSDWVLDAINEAVKHNKRNLAYIEAILKRWKQDGRNGNGKSGRIPPDGKYHTMEEIIGDVEPEEESEAQL